MGSYRGAYPPGRASARAAYHSSAGPPLFSHEAVPHLDLLSRNRVSGYANHVGGGLGSFTLPATPVPLLRSDLHVGGFHADLNSWALPGNLASGAITPGLYGGRMVSEVQGPMQVPNPHQGPTRIPNPHYLATDMYGSSSYSHPSDAYGLSLYSDPTALPLRMRLSDYSIENHHHPLRHSETLPERKPLTVSTGQSYGGIRKRKAPSMDALIKETWELHSLFRASAAASKSPDSRSHDGSTPCKRQDRKPANVWHDVDPEESWMGAPCPRETHEEDIAWSTPFKVPSPQKELDDPDNKQEQLEAKLQRCACEKVVQFMRNTSDDDDEDDDDDGWEEDSYVSDTDNVNDAVVPLSQDAKNREEQAYDFFTEVLKDKELQKLYTEQCYVGKFECLVCSSIPGKPIKRYPGLVSVVMHASKIIKTKRKHEHRGFARAVCTLLGWDICRMPSIPPQGSTPQPRCCIPTEKKEVV